jgi:transposase
MSEEERICEILSTIQKIKESKQPVRGYFKQNSVPFSRAQYYTYCKTFQKYGEEGLRDKRKDGNYTKLKERIKGYVVSTIEENRSMPSSQLQSKILNQFDVKIRIERVNEVRQSPLFKQNKNISRLLTC